MHKNGPLNCVITALRVWFLPASSFKLKFSLPKKFLLLWVS